MIQPSSRRAFFGTLAGSAAAVGMAGRSPAAAVADDGLARTLREISDGEVLDLSFAKEPIRIESIELLRHPDGTWLVKARSADGVEAVTVPHQSLMNVAFPVFLKTFVPAFEKKDARQLERLEWETYRFNYKTQGQIYWVAQMALESAVLELLCRTHDRPLADLFGGRRRDEIAVYFASGNRYNKPEQELEHLRGLVAKSGVKALKFRLGARMSRNADQPPKRSERLIPMVREAFGHDFTLFADANSSYDAAEAVRFGRMLEEHGYGMFEEPCPFDDLWSTKKVADELTIPVGLGEQEYSMERWQWVVGNRAADIIQPDLHYGGGFIRATKVARMAEKVGLPLMPHMSGGGLGYVDLVHFASFTPNIGPFQEFKGNAELPVECPTSSLKCEDGKVRVPVGPGFAVTIDPDFVAQAKAVRL